MKEKSEWYWTVTKLCLWCLAWSLIVHEGTHYLACMSLGLVPSYHVISVGCNATSNSDTFFVLIMPYIIGLLGLVFLKPVLLRMAIFCDIFGGFVEGIFRSTNDFNMMYHIGLGYYVVGALIAMTALIMLKKNILPAYGVAYL